MAKPINELSLGHAEIEEVIGESGVSQLKSFETSLTTLSNILESLESSGLLRFVSAFLEHYEAALKVVVDQFSKKDSANAIHNLLLGYTLLSSLDNNMLSNLTEEITTTMHSLDELKSEPPLGLFALMRTMKDPDVNASVRAMLKILASLANKK